MTVVNPGAGGVSSAILSGSREGQYIWLPKQGYLSTWDTALQLASSELVEVSLIGDSTTYGETASGGSSYNQNNYSWAQKLRALSIAAGYTDGGVGIRSYVDSESLNTIDGIDATLQISIYRSDNPVGTTNGSNVVTDTAITGNETGRHVVFAAGFGASGYIATATPGVGFTVVTTQGGSTPLDATSTQAATNCNIYYDGFELNQGAPATGGPLAGFDYIPPNTTGVGFTTTMQGKQATCRLGYIKYASGGGSFTYSVNGGSATTVACTGAATVPAYVDIANPSPGSLCSITIEVTVAGSIDIWPEWVNNAGVVWHKEGVSGQRLAARFPSSSSAVSLGSTYDATVANGGLTNTPNTGPRNLKLACMWLGLNDLNNASTQALAEGNTQIDATGIGIFGALCDNAGIPGIVMCPNFWSYTNALAFAPYFREAHYAATKAAGLAWIDVGASVLPITQATTYGWTFGTTPHMNQAGYDAVANYLWTNLLNPETGVR